MERNTEASGRETKHAYNARLGTNSQDRFMIDWTRTAADQTTGILVLAADGAIIRADGHASRLLGFGGRGIEGMHLSDFLDADYDSGAILHDLAVEGPPGGLRVGMVGRDGVAFEATLSGLALPCACSEQVHTVCAIRRTVPDASLAMDSAEGEIRSGDLAELLPEIVFEMDIEGKLTFVNQKAHEITGYTHGDFLKGLRALEIIAPHDRERAMRNIEEIIAGRCRGPHEYTAVRKDGTPFPILIHSVPVYKSGRPAGLRGIIIDMTEQKRAETDLRIVDSAMASSINAIAIADMEGRLTYVNAAFLRLWRFDSDRDVLRRPVMDFLQTAERVQSLIDALHREGGWIGELFGKRKDGSIFDAETAATLVTDDSGKPIRMMASFMDITDRKRSDYERQQELIRREKLQGVLEMAGATCHEFNQPMQVISGYAELLLRDTLESGLGYDELRRIKDASDRMIEITRKLQQITRYETRKYVGGATIIDIDKSSSIASPERTDE